MTRVRFDREPHDIDRIVLHATAGGTFDEEDVEAASGGRLPRIIAHFLVLNDGTLVYTHDVQFFLNDAGGSRGIDIEFTGSFSSSPEPHVGENIRGGRRLPDHVRLSPAAIRRGRLLLHSLKTAIPTIRRIHPHGQVQRPNNAGQRPKRDSCPGPDVWVNVGRWAVEVLRLDTSTGRGDDPGISEAQQNEAYDQHIDEPWS